MLRSPLELEILVDAYVQDREARQEAKRFLRLARLDNGAATGPTRIRRAVGVRLIALGERLAGGRDGRAGRPATPLRPAGNGAR